MDAYLTQHLLARDESKFSLQLYVYTIFVIEPKRNNTHMEPHDLGDFDGWQFSVFNFPSGSSLFVCLVIPSDAVLGKVALGVFEWHKLFSIFSIDETIFRGWLQDITDGFPLN